MFGKNVSFAYLAASFAQAAWPFRFGFDGHAMLAVLASLNQRESNEDSSMGEAFVKLRPNRRALMKRNMIAVAR